MSKAKDNKSMPPGAAEALTPKISAPVFDAKRLETFSLGDFVELLEAAGMMPTGTEKVMIAEEAETSPIEIDSACLDRLRESRFRSLLEHIHPDPNDSGGIGRVDYYIVHSLLNFLSMTRSLIFHLAGLKRRENKLGRNNVPVAEPGQPVFTAFTLPIGLVVNEDGLLSSKPLVWYRQRNPVPILVDRLVKILEGADPACFRRCAFSKCGRIFYARRIDQLCCSPRHNNNRLQREWYQSNKLEAKAKIAGRANRREELKARKRNKP
jgi:hypothetical protein